jgi:hypothetical protein
MLDRPQPPPRITERLGMAGDETDERTERGVFATPRCRISMTFSRWRAI